MNFLKAVQGIRTQSGKVKAIQSAAETEIHRELSQQEIASLTRRFTLDELFENIEKVITFFEYSILLAIFSVWLWVSQILFDAG